MCEDIIFSVCQPITILPSPYSSNEPADSDLNKFNMCGQGARHKNAISRHDLDSGLPHIPSEVHSYPCLVLNDGLTKFFFKNLFYIQSRPLLIMEEWKDIKTK